MNRPILALIIGCVLLAARGAQALTSTRGCATAARRGSRPDRARPIIATLAIWSKRG